MFSSFSDFLYLPFDGFTSTLIVSFLSLSSLHFITFTTCFVLLIFLLLIYFHCFLFTLVFLSFSSLFYLYLSSVFLYIIFLFDLQEENATFSSFFVFSQHSPNFSFPVHSPYLFLYFYFYAELPFSVLTVFH